VWKTGPNAGASILDVGNKPAQLSADLVNLMAGNEIGQPGPLAQIDLATSTVTATANDNSAGISRGIWLGNTGALTVPNAMTADGVILIDAATSVAGNLTALTVVANGGGGGEEVANLPMGRASGGQT